MTLTGSLRFARYQLELWRRTWYGSAFSVFVAPILYLAGIGLGLGAIVSGGGASDALGGVSYAAFAGTGLLAASSMQTGVGELSWPVLGAITYTRTWVASTATPIGVGDLVGGMMVMLGVRLLVASSVFAVALLVLGLVGPMGALVVIAPGVLTGLAWGAPMFAFAAWAPEGSYLGYAFRFVVVPAFILSGTFFPVSELPEFARVLAALSPLWHGVELVRLAGLGIASALHPLVHLAVLLATTVLGVALAVRTLTTRLQP